MARRVEDCRAVVADLATRLRHMKPAGLSGIAPLDAPAK
jgi:hypothetical protein